MGSFKDLTGQRFGRLVALSCERRPSGKDGRSRIHWLCECDCGNGTEVDSGNLNFANHTRSCGCLTKETAIKSNTSHGLSGTRFYQTWRDMIDRTTRKKNVAYERYGGKGITVCGRWMIFENFMNDMYESYLQHCSASGEKRTSIDRIKNEHGYSKENCKWSTPHEQSMNRCSNKPYLINGETLTAYEISIKYNLTYSCVMHRINRKWSPERIISPMRRW